MILQLDLIYINEPNMLHQPQSIWIYLYPNFQ